MITRQHSGSTISILVVEDDTEALALLKLMIAKKFPGTATSTAENGRAGLELFNKRPADIVITDINMPVMDGIDMACEIKTIKANTKFIVLTAYNEKRFFEKFSEIGFSGYLLKPIEFNKLFAAIEKCIAEIT